MTRPARVPSHALRVSESSSATVQTGTARTASSAPVVRSGQDPRESTIAAAAAESAATNSRSASTANRSARWNSVSITSAPITIASARRSRGEGRGSGPRRKASRAAATTSTPMTRPDAVM